MSKNSLVNRLAAVAAIAALGSPINVMWQGFRNNFSSGGWSRRTRIAGKRNPAGSKLIRQFYRNKHGIKADYADSVKWYSAYKP